MVLLANKSQGTNSQCDFLQIMDEALGNHDSLHFVDVEEDKDKIFHHILVSIMNDDHQVDIVVVDGLAREDSPLVVDDVLKNLPLLYLQLIETRFQFSMNG